MSDFIPLVFSGIVRIGDFVGDLEKVMGWFGKIGSSWKGPNGVVENLKFPLTYKTQDLTQLATAMR